MTTTLVTQRVDHPLGTIALVRDGLGYWHWLVDAKNGERVRSRPAQRAFWFGHFTRRGALRAARKTLRLPNGAAR